MGGCSSRWLGAGAMRTACTPCVSIAYASLRKVPGGGRARRHDDRQLTTCKARARAQAGTWHDTRGARGGELCAGWQRHTHQQRISAVRQRYMLIHPPKVVVLHKALRHGPVGHHHQARALHLRRHKAGARHEPRLSNGGSKGRKTLALDPWVHGRHKKLRPAQVHTAQS